MTRPLTESVPRLHLVPRSGVEGETKAPVQSLAQPAKEAKGVLPTFAPFKSRSQPSPPRRAKVPAFQRQGSQPRW